MSVVTVVRGVPQPLVEVRLAPSVRRFDWAAPGAHKRRSVRQGYQVVVATSCGYAGYLA